MQNALIVSTYLCAHACAHVQAGRGQEDVADGLQGGSGAMAGVGSGNGEAWGTGSNRQNGNMAKPGAGCAAGPKINFMSTAAASSDKKGQCCTLGRIS